MEEEKSSVEPGEGDGRHIKSKEKQKIGKKILFIFL